MIPRVSVSRRLMKLRKANMRPRLFRGGDVEQMPPKQISISSIRYEYLEQENASSVSLHRYKTSKIDCANGVRRTCYLAYKWVRCWHGAGGEGGRFINNGPQWDAFIYELRQRSRTASHNALPRKPSSNTVSAVGTPEIHTLQAKLVRFAFRGSIYSS